MMKYFRKLRKFFRGRESVAAIEFSLVAFPFFLLLFMILETGYFFLFAIELEGAAAEGARQIRTGAIQQAATPAAALTNLQTAVCSKIYLSGCSDLIFDVQSYDDFNSIPSPPPAPPATQAEAAFLPGNPGSTVVVKLIYNWHFITPLISNIIDTKQLISTVAFRNEPYPPP